MRPVSYVKQEHPISNSQPADLARLLVGGSDGLKVEVEYRDGLAIVRCADLSSICPRETWRKALVEAMYQQTVREW